MTQFHWFPDWRCRCGAVPYVEKLSAPLPEVVYAITCVSKACGDYGWTTFFRPADLGGSERRAKILGQIDVMETPKFGFTGFSVEGSVKKDRVEGER